MLHFKRLGERVMAGTFGRQVVVLQVALLNWLSKLSRPQTCSVWD